MKVQKTKKQNKRDRQGILCVCSWQLKGSGEKRRVSLYDTMVLPHPHTLTFELSPLGSWLERCNDPVLHIELVKFDSDVYGGPNSSWWTSFCRNVTSVSPLCRIPLRKFCRNLALNQMMCMVHPCYLMSWLFHGEGPGAHFSVLLSHPSYP